MAPLPNSKSGAGKSSSNSAADSASNKNSQSKPAPKGNAPASSSKANTSSAAPASSVDATFIPNNALSADHAPPSDDHNHSHSHGGKAGNKAAPRVYPPPDPHLNGPNDYKALIPISLISIITLFVLWLCAPATHQWNPPVDHNSLFLGFEFPGRATIGGVAGWTGDGGTGTSGAITYSRHMGTGGITPGTRSFWPFVGRQGLLKKLRTTLLTHPLAVIIGKSGSGRSSLIARFVDSARRDNNAVGPTPVSAVKPNFLQVSSGGTFSEYNVILWLDASSLEALNNNIRELAAYLRTHTFTYSDDKSLANVQAWLYKQERFLLIFENCNLDRTQLLHYAPVKGGHSIIILTQRTGDSQSQLPKEQQGFDLTTNDTIYVGSLTLKMSAKLLGYIGGDAANSAKPIQMRSLLAESRNHTGVLTSLGLILKRHQRTWDFEKLQQTFSEQVTAFANKVKNPEGRVVHAVAAILFERMLESSPGLSKTDLQQFLQAVYVATAKQQSRSIPLPVLAALLAPTASSSSVSDAQAALQFGADRADSLVRAFAFYGLACEHELDFVNRENLVLVFFPSWLLTALWSTEPVKGKAFLGELEFSTEIASHSWANLHRALLDHDAFMKPLLYKLAASSSSAYLIPTASVVSSNPHHIATLLNPHEIFLSSLAVVMDDVGGSNPLRHMDSPSLVQILHRVYGGFQRTSVQDELMAQVSQGSSLAQSIASLLALAPNVPSTSSSSSSPSEAATSHQRMLDVLFLVGAFHVDIMQRVPRGLELFLQAVNYSIALAEQQKAPIFNNPHVGKLVSKNHLMGQGHLMDQYPLLSRPTLPVDPYVASSLSLAANAFVWMQNLNNSAGSNSGGATLTTPSSTSTLEARLYLDLALNHVLFSLEVKKKLYASLVSSTRNLNPIEGLDVATEIFHPSLTSSYSQLAQIYTFARDLEAAKILYSKSLKIDAKLGLFQLLAEEDVTKRLLTESDHKLIYPPPTNIVRNTAIVTPGTDAPLFTVSNFNSLANRTHWELVSHQLKFIRDLSILAYMESALFYYDNAITLHEKAYHLEVGLYGTDSTASASRWLSLAHTNSLFQKPKESHEFYTSSLEYHKALLNDHADLRLIACHFYHAKSHNLIGRGRSGRKSLELVVDMKTLALGGEVHRDLMMELELLADTTYALSQYQDSLGFYRRLLNVMQLTLGDNHPQTVAHKTKLMNVYQTIQQVNEEQRKRQATLQQEQLKKMQQQRQKDEEERKKQQQAAKAKKNDKDL